MACKAATGIKNKLLFPVWRVGRKQKKKNLSLSFSELFLSLSKQGNNKRKKIFTANRDKNKRREKKKKFTFLDTTFNYQIVFTAFSKKITTSKGNITRVFCIENKLFGHYLRCRFEP